jgi:hypothetical protein
MAAQAAAKAEGSATAMTTDWATVAAADTASAKVWTTALVEAPAPVTGAVEQRANDTLKYPQASNNKFSGDIDI